MMPVGTETVYDLGATGSITVPVLLWSGIHTCSPGDQALEQHGICQTYSSASFSVSPPLF